MPKPKLELERLSEHERVLKRPGMFLGALEAVNRKYRTLDLKTLKVENTEFKASDGLEHTFIEASSNAGDNVSRSRQNKVDPGDIKVKITDKRVIIHNTGLTFEIKKFKNTDLYQQEIAFGVLGSSTNYNDAIRDDVGGVNGVGIKLTNIYSKEFILKVGDSKNKKLYTQVWQNNMFTRHEPIIADYDGDSFVEIEYEIDFDRFDPLYKNGYDQNMINLFAFHCASLSFTHKVRVYFNNVLLNYDNALAYLNLIHNKDASFDNQFIMYASNGANNYKVEKNEITSVNNQKIELIIYDTPDKGEIVSFVNGIVTREGGVHVNAVLNKIKDYILTDINKNTKDSKYKLTLRDLKPHISILMSCFLKEPKFKSQTKDHLNSPTPNIKLKAKDLESVKEWNLMECLKGAADARMNRVLAKTDGKNKGRIKNPKAEDAPAAGKKESHKCILYVTEGLSAKNYAIRMFKHMNGGKGKSKYHGVYPLKGKPLNVMKINTNTPEGIEKLKKNYEYVGLKEILGLKEGMVFNSLNDIKKNLRYGKLVILADSDVDGKHIVGLTLTQFIERNKSLLKLDFIQMFRTPVVRAFKGKKYRGFFTLGSLKKWLNHKPKGWYLKYCKGLGSSSESEIKKDVSENRIENLSLINLKYTENSDRAMYIAFSDEKQAKIDRKKWVETYDEYEGIENIKDLTIEDFINKEMIEHAIVNNSRTIPGMDGLKESQRKIIYTALNKWTGNNNLKSNDLINRAVNFTNYHYGPKSLVEALNKMALDYTGSNNLAYFEQEGMFGTRYENGKDAAAERYTSVGKMWWWNYIFKSSDKIIYKYVEEEGKICEPVTLWPIIPMFLVNGAWGIGTGWSTFIPNYNPLDVCDLIKAMIKKEKKPQLIPWYRDFKGTIKVTTSVKDKNTGIEMVKNILEPDVVDYDISDKKRLRMVLKGSIEYNKDRVIITEIPLGDSISKYKKFLEKEIEAGRLKNYDNDSDDKNIHIELIGYKMPSQNKSNLIYRKLRLIRAFGMTNMVILNADSKPECFRSIHKIITYWYKWRLNGYKERLIKQIQANKDRLKVLKDRITFIEAVLLGYELKQKIDGKTIIVAKETDESIKAQIEHLGLDINVYRNMSLAGISKVGIEKAQKEYEELETEIGTLSQTSAEAVWLKELEEFMTEYKKWLKKKEATKEKQRKENLKKKNPKKKVQK